MKFSKYLLSICLLGLSLSVKAYSPSDQSLAIYQGLQDYDRIFNILGYEDDTVLGTIKNTNYLEKLLAPWQEASVNNYLSGVTVSIPEDIKALIAELLNINNDLELGSYLKASLGSLKSSIITEILSTARTDRYFMSGHRVTKSDQLRMIELVIRAGFAESFMPEARGITVSDAHASFLPSDEAITNNLYEAANSASDQKTSSTIIPANTPVFIISQLYDQSGLSPEDSSWLLIWRPEFGIKFVRSNHIGLPEESHAIYESAARNSVSLASSDRITTTSKNHQSLRIGTPIPRQTNSDYLLAVSILHSLASITPVLNLQLYRAHITPSFLSVRDSGQELKNHLSTVAEPFTVVGYRRQLHQTTFVNPHYSKPNINRSFAWGEGILGHDNYTGQDVSTFIRKLLLPFGLSLPRHSWAQVHEGIHTNLIVGSIEQYDNPKKTIDDPEQLLSEHHQLLTDECTLGRFTSFAPGSHAACLGSVTIDQLRELDPLAADEALNTGGMSPGDRVPLLSFSPIGMKDGDQWHITGKTAIYPVFKAGPYKSWVAKPNLFIYSYFETEVAKDEL